MDSTAIMTMKPASLFKYLFKVFLSVNTILGIFTGIGGYFGTSAFVVTFNDKPTDGIVAGIIAFINTSIMFTIIMTIWVWIYIYLGRNILSILYRIKSRKGSTESKAT
jgi:hypothetical protein